MGEGHYRLIGVGCLNGLDAFAGHQDADEALSAWVSALEAKGIRAQRAYESEPDYLCVVVALDNLNARTKGQDLLRFSSRHIPHLLQVAAVSNPELDVTTLLAEFEQRPVLSQQIAALSRESKAHWRNGNLAESERLEGELLPLYEKTLAWHRFACILPELPEAIMGEIPASAVAAAYDAWEAARRVAATDFGVSLPVGRLILADDWD